MRLYHTTTQESAELIRRSGFRDAKASYGFAERLLTGVFFADRPLSGNEGAKGFPVLGDPVIVIELPEEGISKYEQTAVGCPYREWCLPAKLVNRLPRRVIYDPLDGASREDWWEDL